MSLAADPPADARPSPSDASDDGTVPFQWSDTPLGPVSAWPASLRATVNLVVDAAVPMIILWGPRGIALYNDAFAPLAGDLHPDLFAKPIGAFNHPLCSLHARALDAVLKGECVSMRDQALTIRQNDRPEDIWVTLDYSPLRDEDGSIAGALCIMKNTTERKRAEQEIRENESRWKALFEQMKEGFFIGEAVRSTEGEIEDFRLLEFNTALQQQFSLPPDRPSGRSLRDVVPHMEGPVLEALRRTLSSGEPTEFELSLNGPPLRWYEARAQKVSQERLGVLLLDVTSRKQAELTITESEAKFRLLAQSMPNHVWTARANGHLDWFNERVYDFGGLARGTLDGENWIRMVHPEDLPRISEAWQAAVANGHLYKAELRLRRRDGVYHWHIVRAVPVRNKAGDIKRWIGTNTDIDDQKSAETALAELAATLEQRVETRTAELLKTQDALRQSQKMEAIGNLTGGIAHDFNNLLQVISGNLHLIAKDMTGNPVLEARLQNAIKGVTRGAKLASQLLAFGRRQPLTPKVLNIGRLIRNMDDILHRALGEAITVETLVDDHLWNTEVDPGNMENAILNLAINARDAMDNSGHVVIEARNVIIDTYTMRGNMELTAGQYVMVAVRDSGCGMSEAVMEKVFEPFFTTKPEGKGTGLGLSMVYGFVKQSGGHVMIESEEEGLPVSGGCETILVAEDDEAVRETVVAILADLGYRVLRARDGATALTVLESGAPIDLLFTDMIMPGAMKIADLVHLARQQRPRIGILLTSGYAGAGEPELQDSGIELLQKPYSREALAIKVRRALDGARAGEPGLPQRSQAPSAPAASETPDDQRQARPDGKRVVLLCEDDYLIRLTTAEILEEENYAVLEAGSGAEALAALETTEVDVLVTDFGLPDMTGVDLLHRVRDLRPGLPVLLATGHVDVGELPEGPTEQLTKPFADTDLTAALGRLLKA
ncbi:response regulator [Gellertiella hungarica]|uniref:response regulator n=1 Tax=Gellertiella hungarica TaxID=1572859 RepID=UPI00406BCBE7